MLHFSNHLTHSLLDYSSLFLFLLHSRSKLNKVSTWGLRRNEQRRITTWPAGYRLDKAAQYATGFCRSEHVPADSWSPRHPLGPQASLQHHFLDSWPLACTNLSWQNTAFVLWTLWGLYQPIPPICWGPSVWKVCSSLAYQLLSFHTHNFALFMNLLRVRVAPLGWCIGTGCPGNWLSHHP